MSKQLQEAARRLAASKNILVLTGAGISADSGIPTFRGKDGLWNNRRGEELASIDLLLEDPKLAWQWYDAMRVLISKNKPNPGHLALAALEKMRPDLALATQNIDGYHSDAGSRRVFELHGNFWRLRCMACGKMDENRQAPIKELPPKCACGGLLRPDIVLYGEQLPVEALEGAFARARESDFCLVVGTSCVVYPAALLPQAAKRNGAFLLEVNPENTQLSEYADMTINGTAAAVLPKLVHALQS